MSEGYRMSDETARVLFGAVTAYIDLGNLKPKVIKAARAGTVRTTVINERVLYSVDDTFTLFGVQP